MTEVIGSGDLLASVNRAEPAFAFATWFSTWAGFGVYGVNLLVGVIFASGLFKFCRRVDYPWLGLMVAFPMLIMVVACSASRQTAAIGILLWLVSDWRNTSVTKRVLWILAASMFHYSAAFMLCFVALDLDLPRGWKLFIFTAMVAATIGFMGATGGGEYYITTYVTEQSAGAYSPGAVQHIMLNAIPATLLLLGAKVRQKLFPASILVNLGLLAIVLIPVASFASLAAARISLYLFPVSICAFASLPSLLESPVARAMARMLLAITFVGIAVIWLAFANNSFAYKPYDNVIFMQSTDLHL